MSNHNLLQARIIHLSDLHLGRGHRFLPPASPAGSAGAARGYPTLAASIARDLAGDDFAGPIWHGDGKHRNPLLIAVSGDLSQTGRHEELKAAGECIKELCAASPLSAQVAAADTALVPGNHDLLYDKADPVERWGVYCAFDQAFRGGTYVPPDQAYDLSRVSHRPQDALIVAEINSAFYVTKDTDETHRGQVDEGVLSKLTRELKAIPSADRRRSLKIAVVHHHPIVLPFFAEPARGYDAILGATKLLQLLRDHEFHLVLHGHKHFPHTFSYDPQCAWTVDPPRGLFVVAGGSAGAGAAELPAGDLNATNTYNVLAIKWNPEAKHGRIRVVTRGLRTRDAGGRELLAADWHWETLKVDDRLLGAQRALGNPSTVTRPFDAELDGPLDQGRKAHYQRLRGNMLVVDVIPSLDPGQGYEATAYLATHTSSFPPEAPVKVEWSAGPRFKAIKTCSEAPFAARFSYWAPAMLQARLHFRDGSVAQHEIYAHTFGFQTHG